MNLVLAVPAVAFDALHQAILDLGTLKVSSLRAVGEQPLWQRLAALFEITVTFHPKPSDRPVIAATRWNPVHTPAGAWRVFLTIFGFLVDILIWVMVLVGPFILIGLGLRPCGGVTFGSGYVRRSRPHLLLIHQIIRALKELVRPLIKRSS